MSIIFAEDVRGFVRKARSALSMIRLIKSGENVNELAVKDLGLVEKEIEDGLEPFKDLET